MDEGEAHDGKSLTRKSHSFAFCWENGDAECLNKAINAADVTRNFGAKHRSRNTRQI